MYKKSLNYYFFLAAPSGIGDLPQPGMKPSLPAVESHTLKPLDQEDQQSLKITLKLCKKF